MLPNLIRRSTPNGNCLYNSCSLSIIGDECLSLHLRCLSTIELLLHSGYYASHPQTSGLIRDGKPLDENTLFTLMLSQTAFKVFEKNNKKLCVQAEAIHNAKSFTFSSMLCMLALSSVLGMTIESYYPVGSGSDIGGNNIYEYFFNRTISPRTSALASNHKIHILCCSTTPANFLGKGKHSLPYNHYVPLLPKNLHNVDFSMPDCFSEISKEASVLPIPPLSLPNSKVQDAPGPPFKRRKQSTLENFKVKGLSADFPSELVRPQQEYSSSDTFVS